MQTIKEIHKEFDKLFSEPLLEVNLAYEEDYQKLWKWIKSKLIVSRVELPVSDDFGIIVKKTFWDGTLKGRILELEHLILMEKRQALNIEVLETRLKKWHDSQNSR